MRLELILAGHARRTPGKTAVVVHGKRISYAELHESSLRVAAGLRGLGVRPGDRVVGYLPNDIAFVQLMFATFHLGAILVPVNTRLTAKELTYFTADSEAGVLCVDSSSLAALDPVADAFKGMHWVVTGTPRPGQVPFGTLAAHAIEELPEIPLANCEDCMVIYTSGTTGRPKGAVITMANFIIMHHHLNALDWGLRADDVFLVTTPLAHRTGMARMMNALCVGATLVVMERFDPVQAVKLIEQEKVSALGMVPTVARMLLPHLRETAERCSSLRHIIVTGEAFPVEVKKALIDLLPQVALHSFFAMTEVGAVTCLNHDEQFTHAASVGRVTPGVEVKLVDDSGKRVPVGEAGELLVRTGAPGNFLTMRGYYRRPEETAKAIVDGWVHTGDMARLDEDGYMYIVDRKKDMVLSGGFNIYTKEVEQVLLEHADVLDAAVVGVPDAIFGEAVAAFIELRAGSRLDAATLIEHCRERIAGYKKPKHVFFVDNLPRNALGKVLKAQLRESAAKSVEHGAA
ncbi:class I adenylate-forming enzyme family protein [Lacisediminimonas profundi]|uniref:class I adenylate-forming enzyme family protein n=1 Tax=Lacisediminimonas profundi TaxID=2603856 RepID=UPI00124B6463|nr:AMP-binding protein [Lacisediminimonas profundi]